MTPKTAGFPLTDVGNGERLAARYHSRIRYVHDIARFLFWDGVRWVPDNVDGIDQLAKRTVRAIDREVMQAEDDNVRAQLRKHAHRSEHRPRIKAMIECARSEKAIAMLSNELDAYPGLLTVANGTVDLRTGVLRPHRRRDYATKLAPATYDATASCPRWNAFLNRVFDGDSELIGFIQRAVGYSLGGETTEQVVFLLYGGGANGKTTFLELLRALLGDYAVQAAFETFLMRRNDGPREDIARLARARLVTSSEAGEGRRLDAALVKSLTGGDVVAARHLYQGTFEFRPEFKLWLASNHRPEVHDVSEAMWRRVRLVPFDVCIPLHERDASLGEELRAELPGILNWAIAGAVAYRRRGLGTCMRVRLATDEYRRDSDIVGRFIAEECVIGQGHEELAMGLFVAYKDWCATANEPAESQTAFGRQLQERGFSVRNGGRAWAGRKVRSGLALTRRETDGDGLDPALETPLYEATYRKSPQRDANGLPLSTTLVKAERAVR